MNKNDNGLVVLYTVVVMFVFLIIAALINEASTPKCISSDCDNDQAKDSSYCYLHKLYSGSSSYKSKSSGYSSGNGSYKSSSSGTKSSGTSSSSGSKSSTSKKSSFSSSYGSYDDGYEDVYENEDYDWDRYYSDEDYADGVDDAMDELDW